MPRAIRFDKYGHRDVLYVAEVEMPVPATDEVVVEVRAAAINPGEVSIREGYLHDRFPASFPSGEGTDLTGVISAVGEGVTGWEAGDEVLGWSWRRSSHAEYVAVPAEQLVAKPTGLSWEVAGSLNVAGCTAWAAVNATQAGPGDVVAVSAAAGGVGVFTVQLLALKGARVLAIASEPHHEWLRAHQADPVAYGDDLAERLRATVPGGITAFIDLFGPQYVDLAVELGVAPERIDTIISWQRAAEIGAKTEGSAEGTSTKVMAELARLADGGQLDIPIAATYPLSAVQDAFAELEQRHTRGKIVLVP
jgi:NADPH:quinone reductase-like Zn-dependent oxidoreductase